jgi:hypothetical protein
MGRLDPLLDAGQVKSLAAVRAMPHLAVTIKDFIADRTVVFPIRDILMNLGGEVVGCGHAMCVHRTVELRIWHR